MYSEYRVNVSISNDLAMSYACAMSIDMLTIGTNINQIICVIHCTVHTNSILVFQITIVFWNMIMLKTKS